MLTERWVSGPLLPLAVRGALLLVAVSAVVVARAFAEATGDELPIPGTAGDLPGTVVTSTSALLGAGLAITAAAALGTLPLSRSPLALIQPYAEIIIIAAVVALLHPSVGGLFTPLLLVPAFVAGWRGGLRSGAGAAVVGTVTWVVTLVISRSGEPTELIGPPVQWSLVLVAAGLIGGWVRRLTLATATASETAYEEAFRLLSALQDVSRDLSLGLDPATLGAVLLDDIASVQPDGRRTVFVRGSDGQLNQLAAAGRATGDDSVDQWVARAATAAGRPERAIQGGSHHEAVPLLMGSRVVGVVTLHGGSISPDVVERVGELARAAAPALATALLFDEVRQLATVDERQRLAREIHDGVAQELASISYLLDDLGARVPEQAADDVRVVSEHVRRVTGELRMSIFDLRSDVTDEVSLGSALNEHAHRVSQQSKLVVYTVSDEPGGRLPHAVEIELLRIAQEAMTNVRKHARASTVWVECTVAPPRARLRIADDGQGLRPLRVGAMGLRGMRERADRIGATLRIGPREGGGTVVEVRLGGWDDDCEARAPAWTATPSGGDTQ